MVYVFLEDPDLNSIAVLLINQIHCDTKTWKAEICNNIPAHITKPEAHKRKIYNWSILQTQQPRCPAACRLCDPRPRHVIVATTLAPVIPSPAHPTHQPKIPRIKYTYRLVAKTSRHRDRRLKPSITTYQGEIAALTDYVYDLPSQPTLGFAYLTQGNQQLAYRVEPEQEVRDLSPAPSTLTARNISPEPTTPTINDWLMSPPYQTSNDETHSPTFSHTQAYTIGSPQITRPVEFTVVINNTKCSSPEYDFASLQINPKRRRKKAAKKIRQIEHNLAESRIKDIRDSIGVEPAITLE